MVVVASFLFVIAGVTSLVAAARAFHLSLPALRYLRRKLRSPEYGSEIVISLLEAPVATSATRNLRRRRQQRHLAAKPTTHRLRQSVKPRTAA
ncbi:hypothetical protein [Novosphingobium sp. M1R2S20]|uniref:Secreted protein n=1 Tax=Novosphingobium rhizovicinum TaxID=3228928 RepID=A0ABV3RBK9_9SPHN